MSCKSYLVSTARPCSSPVGGCRAASDSLIQIPLKKPHMCFCFCWDWVSVCSTPATTTDGGGWLTETQAVRSAPTPEPKPKRAPVATHGSRPSETHKTIVCSVPSAEHGVAVQSGRNVAVAVAVEMRWVHSTYGIPEILTIAAAAWTTGIDTLDCVWGYVCVCVSVWCGMCVCERNVASEQQQQRTEQ